MNSGLIKHMREKVISKNPHFPSSMYGVKKIEKQLLKIFLLQQLRKLFFELCQLSTQHYLGKNINLTMECYMMDIQIIQFIIREIVESGEYTLEGIAYYTRIPFDVILDAACGKNINLSITPWASIIELYLQVKPEISQMLIESFNELQAKNSSSLSVLLNKL